MATQFKITAILTFVVGVQLIDLTNSINVVCRVLNNDRPDVVLAVALAADIQSITVNSPCNSQPTFMPPSKGAPKSTQGSGTR